MNLSPWFQRRAFRLRRRNDEARRKARLRRYWTHVNPRFADTADQPRVPDPRECSCYLCRARHIGNAQRKQALAPNPYEREAE